jgi:hypothetical protein
VSDAASELARLDTLNPTPLMLQLVSDLRTQIKNQQAATSTTVGPCAQ